MFNTPKDQLKDLHPYGGSCATTISNSANFDMKDMNLQFSINKADSSIIRKCDYCDYKDDMYFTRIHIKCAHPEQYHKEQRYPGE